MDKHTVKNYIFEKFLYDKLICAHWAFDKILMHNFDSSKDREEIFKILTSLLEQWNVLSAKYNYNKRDVDSDGGEK